MLLPGVPSPLLASTHSQALLTKFLHVRERSRICSGGWDVSGKNAPPRWSLSIHIEELVWRSL
jgi:hypothetical protein